VKEPIGKTPQHLRATRDQSQTNSFHINSMSNELFLQTSSLNDTSPFEVDEVAPVGLNYIMADPEKLTA
jgi:hypothetical protein